MKSVLIAFFVFFAFQTVVFCQTKEDETSDNFRKNVVFGYRFQKKNGNFVFRTGAGWPDCIYLSLGFAL